METVLALLGAMYDGKTPIRNIDIARRLQLNEKAIEQIMRQAHYQGMVTSIQARGWIPIKK